MATFTVRKKAPDKTNKYYYSDLNIWTKKGIGSCTRYAQGRILEIQAANGATLKNFKNTWYPIDMYDRCEEVGGSKVKKPVNGGCFAIWMRKDGSGSHIASVESVLDSGNIYVSQMDSKDNFSYVKVLKSTGYRLTSDYELKGFFTLNLKWSASNKEETQTVTSIGRYKVQAGAYTSLSNAKRMLSDLRTNGISCTLWYDQKTYRVICGSYDDKAKAQEVVNALSALRISSYITETVPGEALNY